ncbi:hypothetical protein BVRB_2g031610 [Beta vulgaris subsp. vulgaris]|uniref:Uncharacterized protein n=1 Tax=Beta vulgaris subsp. vulgaris TaxID=3555 RepID=A0A0J8CX03_BETVV|nr:hypothetical protein BVRB_2g031610 [Beta vulgaris subsp. vulgaris]
MNFCGTQAVCLTCGAFIGILQADTPTRRCQLTVVCCVLPLLLCAAATADCCMFAAVVAGLFVLLDQEMHNEELLPDLSGE